MGCSAELGPEEASSEIEREPQSQLKAYKLKYAFGGRNINLHRPRQPHDAPARGDNLEVLLNEPALAELVEEVKFKASPVGFCPTHIL